MFATEAPHSVAYIAHLHIVLVNVNVGQLSGSHDFLGEAA